MPKRFDVESLGFQISSHWRYETTVTTSVLFVAAGDPEYVLSLDTGLDYDSWGIFDDEHPFRFASVTRQDGQDSSEVRISVERAKAFLRLQEPELHLLFERKENDYE